MPDLITVFEDLETPVAAAAAGLRFIALPIPGDERHRLGKDENGAPALLVSVAARSGHGWLAPITLEHLAVQHDVACRVSRPDGTTEDGQFTVLRCRSTDPALHTYFLRVAGSIVTLLGATPSHSDVSMAIDRLVELFRALDAPPQKSVQGLWAELFLIARARDSAALVRAWHKLPGDRFDFSAGGHRIEVKSAVGRVRQHYFSVEQLRPVAEMRLLIASLFVERAGAGTSLGDLVTQVRTKVSSDAELLLHVDRIVSLTLGSRWPHGQDERFDRELAENSLAFFEPATIPQIGSDLPLGVSEVRFRANLRGVPTVDLRQYIAEGGLFRATLRP